MGRTKAAHRPLPRAGYVVIVVAALLFAACGGDDDDNGGAKDTTPTSAASGKLADLGHGVTADSIKLGIAVVDYDAIKDFVDFTRGDQQKTAQVFVDYINENGGVDGRKIDPVYRKYPPIPGQEPSALSLCTAWTEDDDVFAVLGVFIDFSGDAQLCLTRDHQTIHIGHELEQPWIDESPAGLMLTPDTTKEAAATILINLLDKQDKLKGKTVAILADSDGENRANDVIAPGAEGRGRRPRVHRHADDQRHRHLRGTGSARQLHREVEERERRHGLHGRPEHLVEAVRPEAEERDAGRAADHRRVVDRRAGAGPRRGRHHAEPVRRHARYHRRDAIPSAGTTRASCCSSAWTSTRRRPERP